MAIRDRDGGVRMKGHAGHMPAPFFDTLSPDARPSLEAQVPFPSRLGRPEEYAMMIERPVGSLMRDGPAFRPDGAARPGAATTA